MEFLEYILNGLFDRGYYGLEPDNDLTVIGQNLFAFRFQSSTQGCHFSKRPAVQDSTLKLELPPGNNSASLQDSVDTFTRPEIVVNDMPFVNDGSSLK